MEMIYEFVVSKNTGKTCPLTILLHTSNEACSQKSLSRPVTLDKLITVYEIANSDC